MKVQIFDVKHGACAMITGPNGKHLMIDCGFREGADPWFPSVAFAGNRIEMLIVQNLDEDHVDDLPYVWDQLEIGAIYSNPSVDAAALKAMKTQGMDDGVAKAHAILKSLGPGLIGLRADLGGVGVRAYYNSYGYPFTTTNDLSVAVFVTYGRFRILFGGDLERPGWLELLKSPSFRADLRSVNAIVGSHHGRASGKCDELFDYCAPDIAIFSDDAKQYETQETDSWYRHRVNGIPDYSRAPRAPGVPAMRHVLTTRRDGAITINANLTGLYVVTPERSADPLAELDAAIRAARVLTKV
ncbi:late competence protein ComEC [alpha proteobacterium U9-1i]|nr:late competence protein ComEC [alpha proteobacterium U9-1i]